MMKKTLVLGGGWVGARLCLQQPFVSITTTRSNEKLSQLKTMGLEAVEFDLKKEDTWGNLPSRELISATVITFPLSAAQIPLWQKFFADHIPDDKPILCLGSTRVFEVKDHLSVINEKTDVNVTGQSFSGQSFKDHFEGENWMLAKGATILHLSQIVGDDDDKIGFGGCRSVRSFFLKGYARNGLKLLNQVHVKDICKIVNIFIEKGSCVKSERFIVSQGAFRCRDLAKGLDIDPLPEILPPDPTMKTSKILSTAKLHSILPADYEWTSPVEGVEPVSMGLPTSGPLKYCPSGAAHDRQWKLVELNLNGKWQGVSSWYEREALDLDAFLTNLRNEQLSPSLVIPDTEYDIAFWDADSSLWKVKGFKFAPEAVMSFDFSRKTFNKEGNCFAFDGATGRFSLDRTEGNFFTEVSFYYKNSRSMIQVYYQPEPNSSKITLSSIWVVPFRCNDGSRADVPLKSPQSEVRRSVSALLSGLDGMTCRMQWMSHTRALDETDGGTVQTTPTKSMRLLSSSDSSRLVQSFDDDIVCSIPAELVAEQSFDLIYGCRHSDKLFKTLTFSYSSDGRIDRQTFEKWE